MSFRSLWGPVSTAWTEDYLHSQRQAGACLCFDEQAPADVIVAPDSTWETVRASLPDAWQPDALVMTLPCRQIPAFVWTAPLPLIVLARDWRLHWHAYRRVLRGVDLVVTDAEGAKVMRREGIEAVQAMHLDGLGQSALEVACPEGERDIDLLVADETSPACERASAYWLNRLVALRPRCQVRFAGRVQREEYRRLLARSRMVFTHTDCGDSPGRSAEAVAAGVLLLQDADARGVLSVLQDRAECVCYDDANLEVLLRYYLEHEDERRHLASQARGRLAELMFCHQWEAQLPALTEQLPELHRRAEQRRAANVVPDLRTRAWMHASGVVTEDPALEQDIRCALEESPRDAHLSNALGVYVAQGKTPEELPAVSGAVAHAFQEAWRSDPRHVVSGLNLTEVLLNLRQLPHVAEQAQRTLTMLDEVGTLEMPWLDAPPYPPGLNEFRLLWEEAAWRHAGQPERESQAKLVLLRWRLHSVLAHALEDVAQAFIGWSLRPDLPRSLATLGAVLVRKGQIFQAIPYLRAAVTANPFDHDAARALYEALHQTGEIRQQQHLAEQRRRLSEAAPHLVPIEPWFAAPVLPVLTADKATASPLQIVWHGPQEAEQAQDRINREACLALLRRGHQLSLQPASGSDSPSLPSSLPPLLQERWRTSLAGAAAVHISHQWPPDFTPPRQGHWVLMLSWEFGSLPRGWIEPITQLVDEVWVPNRSIRETCLRSGLAAEQVHVVPVGASADFLDEGAPRYPLQSSKRFKFLFPASAAEQQGLDLLLKAYGQTFSAKEDVCLIINDMSGGVRPASPIEPLLASFRQLPDAPALENLPAELSAADRAHLYAACDCLVYPYRSEGYGVVLTEAMACGLPVLVTGHGPALEVCRDDHAYLLPARVTAWQEKRVGSIETVDLPSWAEPNLDLLRYRLRYIVEHAEEAKQKGQHAQALLRAHFTWDRVAAVMEQRLAVVCARPPRRQGYASASRTNQQPPKKVAASPPTVRPRSAAKPAAAVRLSVQRPQVSLCMIVKNEEANLPACLQSVADLVDEIIVVDTGSTDATKQVAVSMGAKVFDFPWIDSFSAARNESLRHATGEWIFWMDADDRLDGENRRKLRELLAQLPANNAGYVMKCLCLPNAQNGTATEVDHVRLFRNDPRFRWTYRIHEQILPAIKRQGGEIQWSPVVIHHVGYQDSAVRRRKLDRDLRLLLLEYQEQPHDPFTLFNLAQVQHERGNTAEALELLRRSLQRSAPGDSIVRKLYALIAQCHRQTGQGQEALKACEEGRSHYPDDLEILFQEALARYDQGDRPGAISCLERILTHPEGNHFASVDTGLRGYKTRHNLAVYLQEEGRIEEAELQWQTALKEAPGFVPGLVGLAEICWKRQDWRGLDEYLGRLQAMGKGTLEVLTLEARKHLIQREFGLARQYIEKAIALDGVAVWPRVVLTQILLQEGQDWKAAARALQEVLKLDPNHAEARRNLDILTRERGKSQE